MVHEAELFRVLHRVVRLARLRHLWLTLRGLVLVSHVIGRHLLVQKAFAVQLLLDIFRVFFLYEIRLELIMRLLECLHLVCDLLFAAIYLLELFAKAGKLDVEVDGACVLAVEHRVDEATEREGKSVSLFRTVFDQLLV